MSKEVETFSKERQALDELYDVAGNIQNLKEDYIILKTVLQRLEQIDNANPSEALKCLEKLKGMEISSMPFSDEYGTQEVDLNDIRKVGSQLNTDFREYTTTIKQALLKAQEPKQYLKWEDLEFTKDLKCQKVKMNDNDYRIRYTLDDFGGKCCFLYDSARNHYIVLNKQFFNDLHLERVEE